MLNGSGKDTPASGRARLVAITPPPAASAQGASGGPPDLRADPIQSAPDRIRWIVLAAVTLLSAVAGAATVWLVR